MGKRGPKPKTTQTAVLSTRIGADTRMAIEAAAKKSGRTLSAEIEYRLRRSFDEDESLIDRMGGRQVYALLRLVAATIIETGESSFFHEHRRLGNEGGWLTDPFAFEQAVQAVTAVLEAVRPPGKSTSSRRATGQNAELLDEINNNRGHYTAKGRLQEVAFQTGELSLPAKSQPKRSRLAERIASDLGPVLDTLKGGMKR